MSKDLNLEVDGKPLPVYVAEPAGEARGAVIVIHEVWGLTDHIKDICDRVAAEGYVALGPNLFSETNIEEMVSDELAESLFDPERRTAVQPQLRAIMAPIQAPDFAEGATGKLQVCYDYLAEKVGHNVAVMGFCFGGTYSFQLAMTEPRLKAAVPFYGHAEFGVEQLRHISCPVLAFYGEQDERLVTQLPELKQAMKTAGVDFRPVVYPGCGHAFFNDSNKFAYNAEAAADAWQKTLDFLAANLTTS
jgi:carboxymethylenebutenolidase